MYLIHYCDERKKRALSETISIICRARPRPNNLVVYMLSKENLEVVWTDVLVYSEIRTYHNELRSDLICW